MMNTLIALLLLLLPPMGANTDDVNFDYLRGTYYMQSERPALAVDAFQAAVDAQPQSSQIHTALGNALLATGRTEEAIQAFEAAIELNPQNAEAHRSIGRILIVQLASDQSDEEKIARAETMLTRAVDINPNDVESLFWLSIFYDGKGDVEKRYEALKRASDLAPSRPDIVQQTAELAEELGNVRDSVYYFNLASETLERYAERLTDNIQLQLQLGNLSVWDTGKYHIAIRAFDRVITQAGEASERMAFRVESEIGKATALYLMEDYEPAYRLFNKNERFVLTNFNRSIPFLFFTYARSGHVDRALELHGKLASNVQPEPELMAYLNRIKGVILSYGGKKEDAVTVFEGEIDTNPQSPENYLQLAQVYLDQRDYEGATAALKRAKEALGEDHNDVLFLEAVVLERQGNEEEGLAILEQLIRQDPDNHLALNYAGYTLAEMEQELQRAEGYLLRALELDPNQGSYLDSLGWIYFKMGDYRRAEEFLTEALQTKYKSAEVREHLGYLYKALGHDRQALEEFEAALANNLSQVKPTDPVVLEIETLRRNLESRP